MLTTDYKGQLAVLKIQQECILRNIIVSIPTIPSKYDLILDNAGKLDRVQVKYSSSKSAHCDGNVIVRLNATTQKKNSTKVLLYNPTEIDYILAYLPSIDKIVKITGEYFNQSQIVLRTEPSKNNQTKNINNIENFLW